MGDRSHIDHYEVVRTLGRGASAVVRLVKDTNTWEQYAMKIIRADGPEGLAARFEDMTVKEVCVLKRSTTPISSTSWRQRQALPMSRRMAGDLILSCTL